MDNRKERFDRIFRQELGLSDKSIAARMEISKGHFSAVKNERHKATDDFWKKLHRVFPQVDVKYLREGGTPTGASEAIPKYSNTVQNVNLVDINKRLIHLDDTHQDIKKEIYTVQDLLREIQKQIKEL